MVLHRPSHVNTSLLRPRQTIHILGLGNIGLLVAHSLARSPFLPIGTRISLLFHRPELKRRWEDAGRCIRLYDPRTGETNRQGEYSSLGHRRIYVELVGAADEEARLTRNTEELETGWKVPVGDSKGQGDASDRDTNLDTPRTGKMGKLRIGDSRYSSKGSDASDLELKREEIEEEKEADPIKYLVLATKANEAVAALEMVKHRLADKANVLFLQNGMGIPEAAALALLPKRIRLLPGIITHGVHLTRPSPDQPARPFSITHAGVGSLIMGQIPHPTSSYAAASSSQDHQQQQQQQQPRTTDTASRPGAHATGSHQHHHSLLLSNNFPPLIHFLECATTLDPQVALPSSLLLARLRKLVVNAAINPVTVLFDATNSIVLADDAARALAQRLAGEAGAVARAVAGQDTLCARGLTDTALWAAVEEVARQTGNNVSSMLQDVRAGRNTEVRWINGWVVVQGEQKGIDVGVNRGVRDAIEGKRPWQGKLRGLRVGLFRWLLE